MRMRLITTVEKLFNYLLIYMPALIKNIFRVIKQKEYPNF